MSEPRRLRVQTHDEFVRTLDEVLPDLAARREPLLVEAVVGE
jgi:hypothetical protein